MDTLYLTAETRDFELPWKQFNYTVSHLPKLLQAFKPMIGLNPFRRRISFSRAEVKQLKHLWMKEGKRTTKQVPLHAELQIFKHMLESDRSPRSGYIAVSKRCCFLCTAFLILWNQVLCEFSEKESDGLDLRKLPYFSIEGSHGKCYERWQFPDVNVPHNMRGTYIRKLLEEVDLRLMCTMIYPYNDPEFENRMKFYRLANDSIPLVGLCGRNGRRVTELLSIFEDEWGPVFTLLGEIKDK